RACRHTTSALRPVWQGACQNSSDNRTVSSVQIHGPGAQRVWKAVISGIISCVAGENIKASSGAAAGCIEIQCSTRDRVDRVISVSQLSDILKGPLKHG